MKVSELISDLQKLTEEFEVSDIQIKTTQGIIVGGAVVIDGETIDSVLILTEGEVDNE